MFFRIILVLWSVLAGFSLWGQSVYELNNDSLRVRFRTTAQGGLSLDGMQYQNHELTDSIQPPLFRLDLEGPSQDYSLDASAGWQRVAWLNTGVHSAEIVFSEPVDTLAPDSLEVHVFLRLDGAAMDWDMAITGTGQHSLYLIYFPQIDLQAPGNDYAFVPKYSGKIIPEPASRSSWDFHAHYPDGWESTMAYMAYYGNDYGIYIGLHDSVPHFKYFGLATHSPRTLRMDQVWLAPGTGIAGNDWEMPGDFHWEMFHGDWYDAALLYRQWASAHAAYWPEPTPQRLLRRQKMSETGLWCYASLADENDMNAMEQDLREFAAYFDFPVGFLMYNWNGHIGDDDYPDYFPERPGLDSLISHLHRDDTVTLVPYINGRMYDTDLADYPTRGYPYATKQSDETTVWTQHFNNNTFAIMCPGQTPWQDTLRYAVNELSGRLQTDGVYFDQVGAAGAVPCYDRTHGHTRGGGSYWFTGYDRLLQRSAAVQNDTQFLTTEGGGDFVAHRFEGLYTLGWQSDGLVPAFMVVYGGLVDLFGYTTGTSMYGDQRFYGRLGLAASYGIQPGGLSLWLALHRDNITDERRQALEYVRDLGRMRYRLRSFMSFGRMRRPLVLQGTIPSVSFTMWDAGVAVDTTVPAIQHSVWQQADSICVYVSNIRRYDPSAAPEQVDFSFHFNAANYGLNGPISMYEITPTGTSMPVQVNQETDVQVHLSDLSLKAYVFKGNGLRMDKSGWPLLRIIPNPAADYFSLSGDAGNGILEIIQMSGQLVKRVDYRKGQKVDIKSFPAGIYILLYDGEKGRYHGLLIKE